MSVSVVLLNRALPSLARPADGGARFALPADGYYHITPYCECDNWHPDTGDIIQLIDEAAVDAMIHDAAARAAHGETELLVDRDHMSHCGNTEAEGWLDLASLEKRADGLYAKIRPINNGDRLTSGRLRYGSPEFPVASMQEAGIKNKRRVLRPTSLSGHAFTNRPRLGPHGLRAYANSGLPHFFCNQTPPPSMQALAKLLSLPDTASEADISAAIQAIQADLTAAEAELAKLRGDQADSEMEPYKNMLSEADGQAVRALLMSDQRQAGLALLNQLAGRQSRHGDATRQAMHNSAASGTPPFTFGGAPDADAKIALINSCADDVRASHPQLSNEAVHDKAVEAARKAKPGWFKED